MSALGRLENVYHQTVVICRPCSRSQILGDRRHHRLVTQLPTPGVLILGFHFTPISAVRPSAKVVCRLKSGSINAQRNCITSQGGAGCCCCYLLIAWHAADTSDVITATTNRSRRMTTQEKPPVNIICTGRPSMQMTWIFHLHLPITVPTRFRAISHHEWISRCVPRKPCSKRWTVTSDENSAVQTIKTGRRPVLEWNGNCWDGSWNSQEIAGKCLLAECSTARLHLERTSDCMCLYCTESAHILFRTFWCRWELVQGRLQQVWRQDHFYLPAFSE